MTIDQAWEIVTVNKKLKIYDNSFGAYDKNPKYKKLVKQVELLECDYEESFSSLVIRAEGFIEGFDSIF